MFWQFSIWAWRLRIPTLLVSLRLSLLCVSPPKQCVRRVPLHKGHVRACGCNIKMFRTGFVLAQAVLTFWVQHLHGCFYSHKRLKHELHVEIQHM